ncbi:MAG: GLUG motif-containing protein, partial [Phycisphaerae bacterium]
MCKTRFVLALVLLASMPLMAFSGGDGSSLNPYKISTASDLLAVNANLAAHYELAADIDLAGNSYSQDIIGEGSASPFEGTFDGKGHTISNMAIDTANNADYCGLFGYVAAGAVVKNVNMADVVLTGGDYVSALCGANYGTIINCTASGTIDSHYVCGGICGDNYGSIFGCSSSVDVTTTYYHTGSLVGFNHALIKNCSASGDVVSTQNDAGGLVGRNDGRVIECSASGNVGTSSNYGGALIGYCNNGSAVNCYATGNTNAGSQAGGLIGYAASSMIVNCYSTGIPTANGNAGGLIGYNVSSTVSGCFWDTETSGTESGAAGGAGKTTIEMQTAETFANMGWPEWVWRLEDGSYPELQSESPANRMVPDVCGMSAAQAQSAVANKGFAVGGVEYVASWQTEAGKAIGVDAPANGYVPAGSTLKIFISTGAGAADGSKSNPYPIASQEDFDAIDSLITDIPDAPDEIAGCFELTRDIYFNSYSSYTTAVVARPGDTYFTGTFDGNGYLVSGLNIVHKDSDYNGLFRQIGAGGKVSNLSIADSFISTDQFSGLLCGKNYGRITDCSTGGYVSANYCSGGLSGWNDGKVSRCESNVNIVANGTYTGVFCGGSSGTITECRAYGDITSTTDHVGGFVGQNLGIIARCFATGNASGNSHVGGFVGENYGNGYNATIVDCYATGDAYGAGYDTGGFAGYGYYSRIIDCYSTGVPTGNNYVGGFAGYDDYSQHTNCFWDKETSAITTSWGGTGKTSAEMQSQGTFTEVNWSEDVWLMADGNYPQLVFESSISPVMPEVYDLSAAEAQSLLAGAGYDVNTVYVASWQVPQGEAIGVNANAGKRYPASFAVELYVSTGAGSADGSEANPYPIACVADIEAINSLITVIEGDSDVIEGCFELTRDIYFSTDTFYTTSLISQATDTNFQGVFDGAGFKIDGLAILHSQNDYIGLFARIGAGGEVYDLNITNCNVAADERCGAIASYNFGLIENCTADGVMYAGYAPGGIVSHNYGTVKGCRSDVPIYSYGSYCGGICGYNNGSVVECIALGDVISSNERVGGIAGDNRATIRRCFASGNVRGTSYVGGLAGYCYYATISDSYATGNAHGTSYHTGGFVGYSTYSRILNCYSTGIPTGNNYVGGFAGYDYYSQHTNCFWNIETSAITTSWGGSGKTTALMQTPNTFTDASWSSGNWLFADGSYPELFFKNTTAPAMPNVYGLGAEEARAELEQAGYTVNSVQVSSWQTPAGEAVGVNASPYDRLPTSCVVDLYVSTGAGSADGSRANPYPIASVADIEAINLLVTVIEEAPDTIEGWFELTRDIYFSPYEVYSTSIIGQNSDTFFNGSFDGCGFTIYNLIIQDNNNDYLGLFSKIGESGRVYDLALLNCSLAADERSGIICSYNSGSIENCHIAGVINAGYISGGIAAWNYGTITGCETDVAIYSYSSYSGGICGGNSGSVIQCSSDGDITASSSYIGALVGRNDAVVLQSHASGSVSGTVYVGGLIGRGERDGKAVDCYATGNASGESQIGGLIGYNNYGTLVHCYATGTASGTGSSIGGLTGYQYDSRSFSCFWDTETSGLSWSNDGYGRTSAQMKTPETFTSSGWDESVWKFAPNSYPVLAYESSNGVVMPDVHGLSAADAQAIIATAGFTLGSTIATPSWQVPAGEVIGVNAQIGAAYPTSYTVDIYVSTGAGEADGSETYPYPIASVADIDAINSLVTVIEEAPDEITGYFAQTADIYFDAHDFRTTALVSPMADTYFQGSFNGNGFAIYGMSIAHRDNDYLGLFARIGSEAKVTGVDIEEVFVFGDDYIGALCGTSSGLVADCSVSGLISSDYMTGGLIGRNYGSVTRCRSDVRMDAYSTYTGGLVGSNDGSIANSFATGNVTSRGGDTGGLAGENYYGSIANSYATGDVSGSNSTGGLCGYNYYAVISNSYATGNATGASQVGGLIGYCYEARVYNCYSTGAPAGSSNVGGLCGQTSYTTVLNSFWDTEASGFATSSGGTGLTTADMQRAQSFAEAGFVDTIWSLADGRYPVFAYQNNQNTIVPYICGLSRADAEAELAGAGFTVGTVITVNSWQVPAGSALGVNAQPNNFTDSSAPLELYISAGDGGADGSVANPYPIGCMADMLAIDSLITVIADASDVITGSFVMTRDLYVDNSLARRTSFISQADDTYFTGSFDGAGHSITGFAAADRTNDYIGVFSKIGSGGFVENLAVVNASISVNDCAGALCGVNRGTIAKCHSSGSITGNSMTGGLVGRNYGLVRDSHSIVFVTATGSYAGGLIGHNDGTVSDCVASGAVKSSAGEVGGLVGRNSYGIISGSCATGSISGNGSVGGLCGYNRYSLVTSCFAKGDAVNSGGNTGGLIGYNYEARVYNSYSTGAVSGSSNIGGLIGTNSYTLVLNSFWDTETSGIATSQGGRGLTTAQMQASEIYLSYAWQQANLGNGSRGWVFKANDYPTFAYLADNVSEVPDVRGMSAAEAAAALESKSFTAGTVHEVASWQYPSGAVAGVDASIGGCVLSGQTIDIYVSTGAGAADGSQAAPYLIASQEDLEAINSLVTVVEGADDVIEGFFSVQRNIFFDSYEPYQSGVISNADAVWFTGTFDGNDYSIINLNVAHKTNDNIGLFTRIGTGGTVKNVSMEGASVETEHNSAILCGYNNGLILNSNVSGSVVGYSHTGGICGRNENGTIEDCRSDARISSYNYSGGLAGTNKEIITNCVATGSVRGIGDRMGGLVGSNEYGNISGSCASGNVITGNNEIGGLTGRNYYSTVSNCYARGNVNGASYVGGFNGYSYESTTTNCYSTGVPTGTGSYIGGLIGFRSYASTPGCFWDVDTSGITASAGGTGKTTAELTAETTFIDAGWDFLNVWIMSEAGSEFGGYPKFTYQGLVVTFNVGSNGTIVSGDAVQELAPGESAVAPTVVANPGFIFTGWDKSFDNITSSTTVNAVYSTITFTVTFLNGEFGAITAGDATQTVEYGADAASPAVTADPGYAFVGWDKSLDNITADTTITAQYLPAYSVTFLPGAHGEITAGSTEQLIVIGNDAIAPTVTPEVAYNFTGWDVDFTDVTQNLTVTAQYTIKTFTVTFNLAGHGEVSYGSAVQTVEYGADAVAPIVSDDPGYTFLGWDVEFTGITSNLTVTAQYEAALYTVTFLPGAHGAITAGETTQQLTYGQAATAPTVVANTGYVFTGWDIGISYISANTTATAQYRVQTFTVTFVAGANGSITSGSAVQTVDYGAAATAPVVTAKPQYTFTGWDSEFGEIYANTTVNALYSTAPLPDLVAEVINVPASMVQGDSVSLSWSVSNIGSLTATAGWNSAVYISNDPLIGADTYIAGIRSNFELAPSSRQTVTQTITIPASVSCESAVWFVVKVDSNNEIAEIAGEQPNAAIASSSTSVAGGLALKLPVTSVAENTASPSLRCIISRTGSFAATLTLSATSSMPEEISVPETVTIAAGQSSAAFYAKVLDDSLLDGDHNITIELAAAGFSSASGVLTVEDNELPTLSIVLAQAEASEGDVVDAAVTTDYISDVPVTVNLLSASASQCILPAQVVLPAGSDSVAFVVTVIDDSIAEANAAVEIRASSAGYNSAIDQLVINDDDVPGVALSFSPAEISEGAGLNACMATLTRTDNIGGTIQVALTASVADSVFIPTGATLYEGRNSVTFSIGAINNSTVDGSRDVIISGSVLVSSCGCGLNPSNGVPISATLTILDDDGPTLTVLAQPATMPEGKAQAGFITISHNTTLTEDLPVTISYDRPDEVFITENVVIPAGEASIQVPVETLNDEQEDGSQMVSVYVDADGYSSGTTWLLVSDRNLPDIAIDNLQVPSSVVAGEEFEISFDITNIGFWNAYSGLPVKVYYSLNNTVSKNNMLFEFETQQIIPMDSDLPKTVTVTAPDIANDYKIIVVADPDGLVRELNEANNSAYSEMLNVNPAYTAIANTDTEIALNTDVIPIYGSTLLPDGETAAANVDVDIYVIVDGSRRVVTTTTDASGNFAASFIPLPTESGHYIIGACYPAMGSVVEQDAFDILGFERTDRSYITWDMTVGQVRTAGIQLHNRSLVDLSGFTVETIGAPAECGLEFYAPEVIQGGGYATLSYTISADDVSEGDNFIKFTVRITSAEGASLDIPMWFYSESLQALLKATPATLDSTMNRNIPRLVQFDIVNEGAGDSGLVTVDIPNVSWMRLVSNRQIASLASKESATVILELYADESVPFNAPLSGSIAVNSENANYLPVPFRFEAVSDETGGLLIDVLDEYSYYAEGLPHVEGAGVKVKNPYTGALIAQGKTGADGTWLVEELAQGSYTVIVSAPEHSGWQNVVDVLPGRVTEKEVFLQYQAITYSWDVVPTQIEDQYEVELIAKFETNVPAPVITVEAPSELPQLGDGESFIFNVVVANHGLINGENAQLELPVVDTYSFEPISNNWSTLPAQSSIVVPVKMSRSVPEIQSMGAEQALPCTMAIYALAEYYCGPEAKKAVSQSNNIRFLGHICDIISVITSGGGSTTSEPSRGGGVSTGDAGGGSIPTVSKNVDCITAIKCIDSLLGVAAPPLISSSATAYGALNSIANGGSRASAGYSIARQLIPGTGWVDVTRECFKVSIPVNEPLASADAVLSDIDESRESTMLFFEGLMAIRDAQRYMIGLDAIEDDLLNGYLELFLAEADSNNPVIPQTTTQVLEDYVVLSEAVNTDDVAYSVERWNRSVAYWALGYDSVADVPAGENTDFVEPNVLINILAKLDEVEQTAVSRGFTGTAEMVEADNAYMTQYVSDNQGSVCASVSIRINQTVTMTREAFEGTLTLFNGHKTEDMQDIQLDLLITDENDFDCTDLFEISTESLDTVTAIDGTGSLSPNSEGTATILFIPERLAAPTHSVNYRFGGTLSYLDPFTATRVEIDLFPVTLEVKPSPLVDLHYFLQRDVYGDDAMTLDVVEPILPAEMSILVHNKGYGVARNFRIDSAQPEMFENDKGLLIDFALLDYDLAGVALNGLPAQGGLSQIQLGDIQPQSTAIAQWWLTSTLQGHFIGMDASFTHLNSSGNPDICLMDTVELHELIKSVQADDDSLPDFLVTEFDAQDRPDTIYFSDGGVADVFVANAVSDSLPSGQNPAITVSVTADSAGWAYASLPDPGAGKYRIIRVLRADSSVVPAENVWLTDRTLPDGADPVYENTLHIFEGFETAGTEVLTLELQAVDEDPPAVLEFTGIANGGVYVEMDEFDLVFTEEIDPASFTTADISMRYQGELMAADTATITQMDAVRYRIGNLTSLDMGDGFYSLTVQTTGITDVYGNPGAAGKNITWILASTEPAVSQLTGIEEGDFVSGIDSVEVIFTVQILDSSFNPDDLLINGATATGLSIASVDENSLVFEITGFENYLTADGRYTFAIDTTGIRNTTGEYGSTLYEVNFDLDTASPVLTVFEKVIPPAALAGEYNVSIAFDEPLANTTIDWSDFSLFVNSVLVTDLTAGAITKTAANSFVITGLNKLTAGGASIELVFDAGNIADLAGNLSADSNAISWTTGLTVTFVAGEHGQITAGDAVQYVDYGSAATAPTITPLVAYNFIGWDVAFDSVTSDLTVTAQYAIKTFTVTFVAGANGAITSGDAVQAVEYGGSAAAPTITANAAHNFTGWDAAFDSVTSDLTVTAQYAIKTFTVTFVAGANGAITSGDAVQ